MSQDHRLQAQRFELKYLIDEAIAPGIRDFVSSYLELDEYGIDRPSLAYPVHSLYLDSDDLETYQSSINGTKNRFKLRLRYYDGGADSPVFFEIKARVDDCILKQRCGVRREAVPILLAGQLPEPDHLFSTEQRHVVTLQRFIRLLHQLNARPKAHNNYTREAWVSPHDNSVRVTLDRQIRIEPFFRAEAPIEMANPIQVFPDVTVLELKFTNRFPNWFQELVRVFHLMRFSSAKYAEGVVLLGEDRFHNGEQGIDWEGLNPAIHGEFAPPVSGDSVTYD